MGVGGGWSYAPLMPDVHHGRMVDVKPRCSDARWAVPMLLGMIVNPIAGMGGRVGLKGTDGWEVLREALARGAEPWAPRRALATLSVLERTPGFRDRVRWATWSGGMGEDLFRTLSFDYSVLGRAEGDWTTAEDTRRAAGRMVEAGVELLVFAGGDGTAADIAECVDMQVPVLGIPAGVKMFSGVFASTPEAAARLIQRYVWGEIGVAEAEVMDVDEEGYRAGRLSISLKGYVKTPYEPGLILSGKEATTMDEEAMKEAVASRVVEEMRRGATYILGPGSTVAKVAELLGLEKTLLGVDVVRDGRLIVKDAGERELLEALEGLGGEAYIIISPIGGQGSLLGRGNQPISPEVIRRVGLDRILVIATPNKMARLRSLTVDTGDPELDRMLRGYRRVIVGYHEERVVRVQ
jgi:predicted polyphosphate/ATP-dependent NAD kinase